MQHCTRCVSVRKTRQPAHDRDEVALRMLRWRSTHVPRKSLSNSRIDIYIYNIGRDFGEVQESACDPRNLPGNFLGLFQRYINPRFSAINCHSTLGTSDRLWLAVRTTPNLRSQRRLVPKFRTLPNVTIDCFALNGKGRLRRQACPCWLLLIKIESISWPQVVVFFGKKMTSHQKVHKIDSFISLKIIKKTRFWASVFSTGFKIPRNFGKSGLYRILFFINFQL